MTVARKAISVVASLLLVSCLLPAIPAYAEGVEESGSSKGDSSLLIGCAESQIVAQSDYQASTAFSKESFGPVRLDDIAYVLIERSEVPAGEEQNIVISFADNAFAPDSATLTISSLSGTQQFSYGAKASITGAVRFQIEGGTLPEGFYELSGLSLVKDGVESNVLFGSDSQSDYSFVITGESGAVDISSYAINESGNLVEKTDLRDALDEAEGSTVSAVSVFSGSASRSNDDTLVVALDPGHGGSDGGAQGNGLSEKVLTLKIANYCRAELEQYHHVKVFMTRTGDETVDLSERVERAVAQGADVFVSIHINSSTIGSANGAEVIIPNRASWYYQEVHVVGSQLGQTILNQLTALGLADRGTYWKDCTNNERYDDGSLADYFTVISSSHSYGIPGIIVEHAFISNPSDAAFLGNENNLKALGIADATGIAQQYGLSKVAPLYGFKDVYYDTPHSLEIGWLSSSGVSTGYLEDGTFRPFEIVTRGQMAAFLYRLAGSPSYTPSADDKARFADVTDSTAFSKEIRWLGATGISTGYDDGTFRPDDSIVRSDMAAFLRRAAALYFDSSASYWTPSLADQDSISDVSSSTPHAEDVWWLVTNGVSTGYGDGTYRPYDRVIRSDMAAFLYRLTNLPGYVASSSDKRMFGDVDDATDHANDIWWLGKSGISTGFIEDGTYRPSSDVTRGQMAAFLYRLAGSPSYTPSADDKARFADVTDSTAFSKEIRWLGATGISTGYDDGTFRPDDSIVRSDMAAFLRRTYDYLTGDASRDWSPSAASMSHFTDVDASLTYYHAEDVWWLGESGISLGYADGSFGMWTKVTRGDMAAFLHRLDIRANRDMSIMGESKCTVDQMAEYHRQSGAEYPSDVYDSKGAATIDEFAEIVLDEASAEGVRADIVFCQVMKETGWLRFGGSVKAEQCNFAGLGATGSDAAGASFPDVRTGIRAQVQHLKAYGSTEALKSACVDPRFSLVARGSAPQLSDLNGKWAVPGWGYGQSIASMIFDMRQM